MLKQNWIAILTAFSALIMVVGASAQSDQAQTDTAPQWWQHMALTVDLKQDAQPVGGKITELGREGWQLVDVENTISGGETIKTVYYFKRPQ